MDIVVIKFVATLSIKRKKKKSGKGEERKGRKRKNIKEGYVISDTFFATPSAKAFQ